MTSERESWPNELDVDDDGPGGDDAADCLRYLVATKPRVLREVRPRGF